MNMHVNNWMLEADRAELLNPPEQIARHIDECLSCRVALQKIRRGYADLDAGLNALAQPKRKRVWLWVPLPLAAAALIALLLMPGEATPPPPSPLLARLMFPETPVVTPPNGQQAVVMEKNDMTIVWLTKL
jgi:hypothetical protein